MSGRRRRSRPLSAPRMPPFLFCRALGVPGPHFAGAGGGARPHAGRAARSDDRRSSTLAPSPVPWIAQSASGRVGMRRHPS